MEIFSKQLERTVEVKPEVYAVPIPAVSTTGAVNQIANSQVQSTQPNDIASYESAILATQRKLQETEEAIAQAKAKHEVMAKETKEAEQELMKHMASVHSAKLEPSLKDLVVQNTLKQIT